MKSFADTTTPKLNALKLNTRRYLLSIIAVSVLIRLVAAVYLGNEVVSLPGIDDQRSYQMLALQVMGGHGFTVPTGWWPLTQAGAPTAHWSYLYTLYLIVVYSLFGITPVLARIIQVVIGGILWPLLTYRVALRVMGEDRSPAMPWVALIAAAWSALYAYFVYYSAALLTEPFYVTSVLWTFDLALDIASANAPSSKNQTKKWLLLGLAIGIAVLLRQLFLAFVPFLFVWMAWAMRTQTGSAKQTPLLPVIRGAVLAGLVVVALILPWTILNYQNFHKFVLLNTNAGYAFFWANHPIYGTHFVDILPNDMYGKLVPDSLRSLDEASLSSALFQLSLRQIADDPVRYVLLSLSRFQTYFMFWPTAGSGLLSNLTRVASFGLALPFILYGFLLSFRSWRKWSLLYVFIGVYSAIHLLSWAIVRYRLPMDALLLVFAAHGFTQLVARLRRHQQITIQVA